MAFSFIPLLLGVLYGFVPTRGVAAVTTDNSVIEA